MRNNLRNLRDAKRYTLREVAEKTGINYAVLSRLENEVQDISGQYLSLLADFYKVPTDYILGRDTKTLPQTIVYKERDLNYQSIKEYMFHAPKEELIKIAGLIDGILQNGNKPLQTSVDFKIEQTTLGVRKD